MLLQVGSAYAEIFKCKQGDKIQYQDVPCDKNEQVNVDINPDFKKKLEVNEKTKIKDCEICPPVVLIRSGSYRMGALTFNFSNALPIRKVNIDSFYLAETEITWDQYMVCVQSGTCKEPGGDAGWGKGSRPVINVTWKEAEKYTDWLSRKSGFNYRLPSESEWEYAARAGTTTYFSWGDGFDCTKAHYAGHWGPCDRSSTAPVKSYPANRFGLYDMHGNVLEWIKDCKNENYISAPTDGSAWEDGNCSLRVIRGGSWKGIEIGASSSFRGFSKPELRENVIGFRVARGR